MVHPELDGQHEVPASAVGHWTRVGWRRADEPEEQAAEPVAPAPPAPTPNQQVPNRRQRTTPKEGE